MMHSQKGRTLRRAASTVLLLTLSAASFLDSHAPAAAAVRGARPAVDLCALSGDRAWADAWKAAFVRRGVAVRLHVNTPAAALTARTCPGALVGPLTLSMSEADRGRASLAVRLQDAGYVAGAAIGAELGLDHARAPVVNVTSGPDATAGASALLAGLAAGLRSTAPEETLLRVGGSTPLPKSALQVTLDPAAPARLVSWRRAGADERCGVELNRAHLPKRVAPIQHLVFGAKDGVLACHLASDDAPGEAAVEAALTRIQEGAAVPTQPEFQRRPLAVPPWLRHQDEGRRRIARRRH